MNTNWRQKLQREYLENPIFYRFVQQNDACFRDLTEDELMAVISLMHEENTRLLLALQKASQTLTDRLNYLVKP